MAYEWPNQIVRLKKAKFLPIFTCKICDELLEDATAVDECLHLFCRKCIYQKIIEEELKHCPVCNVHLGPEPLKKLRQDESMQLLRSKFFSSRERKVKTPDVATSTTIEKERSSSPFDVSTLREATRNDDELGDSRFSIEDPNEEEEELLANELDISNKSVENIGQNLSPRESSQSVHNEGTENDVESQEVNLRLSEPLNDVVEDASHVVEAARDVVEAASESKSFKSNVQGFNVELEPMKVDDDSQVKKSKKKKKGCKENAKDEKISTNVKGSDAELEPMNVKESSSQVKKSKKKEKWCEANAKGRKISTNVQGYDTELESMKVNDSNTQVNKSKKKEKRCKANAKDGKISTNMQTSNVDLEVMKVNNSDSQVKKSNTKEKKRKTNDEDEEISTNVQGFDAELEPIKVNDRDSQVKKSKKKEKGCKENAKDGKISTNVQGPDAQLEAMKVNNSDSQVKKSKMKEKKHKANDEDEKIITYLLSSDTTKTKKVHRACQKKEPVSREPSKSPQDVQDPTEVKILRNKSIWISLVASENQEGDTPLPQIPAKYIRIKDGSSPVLSVQKYLMKKLNLKSEDEVEITCLGHPVPPALELQKLAKLWFNMSFKGKKITNPGSSVEDYVAIIGYGRRVSHP